MQKENAISSLEVKKVVLDEPEKGPSKRAEKRRNEKAEKKAEERIETEKEVKIPEFREFCLLMLRDEIKRINQTIPHLRETRQIYGKLKKRLIMRPRNEDSVIETMGLYPEFFDAYDQFVVDCEKLAEAKKEKSKKEASKEDNKNEIKT